jgi:hypothetical protein
MFKTYAALNGFNNALFNWTGEPKDAQTKETRRECHLSFLETSLNETNFQFYFSYRLPCFAGVLLGNGEQLHEGGDGYKLTVTLSLEEENF